MKYKEEKIKNHNKQNYKKILIVLFVVIFILLCISLCLNMIQKKLEESEELSYDNIKTVKQVVEYYKARYISEEESKEEGYFLDINLKFTILPYDENDNSNEKYYNDFIQDLAKVIKYKSFKMIDNENDITIKVICEKGKIVSIIINDIEDYFIYMDSRYKYEKVCRNPNYRFCNYFGST